MNDADIEAVLEKACSTPGGKLKATYVLDDLNKIAGAYANEQTRPDAEAALEIWSTGERGELRKGLAMAWLARARAAVAPAASAVVATAKKVEGKVGNIGAAAGEKLANSPLNAKSMAAARQAGGDAARGRMAERLSPAATGMKGRIEPVPGAATGRMEAGDAASVHGDALSSAFRAGADHAASAHASAAARVGRVAARNGFRAGMAIAGAGAAGAGIHAALSDKEHKQRVDAGKHSHQGHGAVGFAKDAPSGELEKSYALGRADGSGLIGAIGATGAYNAVSSGLGSVNNAATHAVGLKTQEETMRAKAGVTRASHVARIAALRTPKVITPKAGLVK